MQDWLRNPDIPPSCTEQTVSYIDSGCQVTGIPKNILKTNLFMKNRNFHQKVRPGSCRDDVFLHSRHLTTTKSSVHFQWNSDKRILSNKCALYQRKGCAASSTPGVGGAGAHKTSAGLHAEHLKSWELDSLLFYELPYICLF